MSESERLRSKYFFNFKLLIDVFSFKFYIDKSSFREQVH